MKSSTNLSKAKKLNSKDKEKQKPQTSGESSTGQNENRKYAGIGIDSISCMAEQVLAEHLSDDICSSLAEDLSYKLRHIIHDASINMKMCKRNSLRVADVDVALKRLNVEKIYGPAPPVWIPFPDQLLSYVDDNIVQLQELAVKESTFYQPVNVEVERYWIYPKPSTGTQAELPKSVVNYYIKISKAALSSKPYIRQRALNDMKTNPRIVPVLYWMYNYVFLLLRRSMLYIPLLDKALNILEAIELNPYSKLNNYDKQLKLISMQILEFSFISITNPEINVEKLCRSLQMLCCHMPEARNRILDKIMIDFEPWTKLPAFDAKYYYAILTVVNALGADAVDLFLWPNMDKLYSYIEAENSQNMDLRFAVLKCCNFFYQNDIDFNIDRVLYEIFGETIVPLRRFERYIRKDDEIRPDYNWKNIKSELFKTQRRITNFPLLSLKKLKVDNSFECYCDEAAKDFKIKIVLHSFHNSFRDTRCHVCRSIDATATNGLSVLNYINSSRVTIGKTSLLLRTEDFKIINHSNRHRHYDLMYYNL